MQALGYGIVLEIEDTVIGYGTDTHDMFEIRLVSDEAQLIQSVHVAFNASTLDQVDEFYQVAISQGTIGNGSPGYRDYEPGYYVTFILDLDGNNLEAICKI